MRKQAIGILGLLLLCLTVWAQQPTRSWDGKYYYDNDFMDGWVVVKDEEGEIDTLQGYIKQYMPYDEVKSCNQVIFKKRLKDSKVKYDAPEVLAYYRYDELYLQVKLPTGKKGLMRKGVDGRISLYAYYGTRKSMDVGMNLSFTTGKELVIYDYIAKDGKIELIDWDDPYGYIALKVWFADCLNFDTDAFNENMTLEELTELVQLYNKTCFEDQ